MKKEEDQAGFGVNRTSPKHVQNLSFNVSDLVRSSSDPIEQRHAQVTICNALRHGRFDESNSMLHMLVYFSRNLIKAGEF